MLGAPRRSRGAPRLPGASAPRIARTPPNARRAPAKPWRASTAWLRDSGPAVARGHEDTRAVVQDVVAVQLGEDGQERRDEPGPPGLVARPEAAAVVAVEVLVEQQQVAPVRVGLEP